MGHLLGGILALPPVLYNRRQQFLDICRGSGRLQVPATAVLGSGSGLRISVFAAQKRLPVFESLGREN
jgi:hypothetical protein